MCQVTWLPGAPTGLVSPVPCCIRPTTKQRGDRLIACGPSARADRWSPESEQSCMRSGINSNLETSLGRQLSGTLRGRVISSFALLYSRMTQERSRHRNILSNFWLAYLLYIRFLVACLHIVIDQDESPFIAFTFWISYSFLRYILWHFDKPFFPFNSLTLVIIFSLAAHK